jgi:4-hydroxythreonine-4-phosphate dehydrogenase
MSIPRIAMTAGEPAGIGPDIVLQLARQAIPAHVVVFADPHLLTQRAIQLGLSIQLDVKEEHIPRLHRPGHLCVKPVLLSQAVIYGQLNPANAKYVLETLHQTCSACLDHRFDALVTAPVHKSVINEAGIPFSGHTEFFAQETGVKQVVMMLMTPKLRVALVTTHLPLSQVSAAITPTRLETVIRILHTSLKSKFGLTTPHILVCGLNPHAGEGGHLGQEEIQVIKPVLNKLRAQGLYLTGPVPADTAFIPTALAGVDVVLVMYHDQGLPVIKQQGFGQAVNVTLGLPIIRTSVDHGTALAVAGSGQASSESLSHAVHLAIQLAQRNI